MKRKQSVIEILATPKMRDGVRLCDAPGCAGTGEYRAPRSRNELTSYYWFCLDHVRAYNAQWNYYAGMSEAEVENQIRADTTWWRPTWPLGVHGGAKARLNASAASINYGVFGQEGWEYERVRSNGGGNGWRPRPGSGEADALAVLDLDAPISRDEIKSRYKALVKRHHPDANGGDKEAEERLKVINHAYSTLMKCAEL